MSRTYLVRIRLNIAVSAALSGLALAEEGDTDDRVLWLTPDNTLLLSTDGDTILLTHTSELEPVVLLSTVQDWFKDLPVADAAVLQVGSKCRSSDEEDSDDDGDFGSAFNYPLNDWLDDGRLLFDVRPSFGPKALVLTTEGRPPSDLQSVRYLRRTMPFATPHWHGRNTLMLALRTDGDVDRLWSLGPVQRVVSDPEISFAACLEIGPGEAALHDLGLVLPGCHRRLAPAHGPTQDAPHRTVVVERPRKFGGEKSRGQDGRAALSGTPPTGGTARAFSRHIGGDVSDPKSFPAANDPLPTANDNRRVTQIRVPRGVRGKPRGRPTS